MHTCFDVIIQLGTSAPRAIADGSHEVCGHPQGTAAVDRAVVTFLKGPEINTYLPI